MPLPNLSSTTQPSNPTFSVGSTPSESVGEFVDRRVAAGDEVKRVERRQFGSSHYGLSDDGRELALAIDQYKVEHHRRYLTCDEMLQVLGALGYAKR